MSFIIFSSISKSGGLQIKPTTTKIQVPKNNPVNKRRCSVRLERRRMPSRQGALNPRSWFPVCWSSSKCPEYEYISIRMQLFSLFRSSNLRILVFRIPLRVPFARVHAYSRKRFPINTIIHRLGFSEACN